MRCAILTVPLDHAGRHPGPKLAEQVSLQVAMADNVDAARGVLVFLTGGRGQPRVPFAMAGDHDLSTPLLWAQQEAARAPRGHLVVIPGSGHSTQSGGPVGRAAVKTFLTSP